MSVMHCLSFFLQETVMYIGKHRSAIVRAPQGTKDKLAAVNEQMKQVTQVMSFTADSITGALSDRIPMSQPGAEWKRPLKSSLGKDGELACIPVCITAVELSLLLDFQNVIIFVLQIYTLLCTIFIRGIPMLKFIIR